MYTLKGYTKNPFCYVFLQIFLKGKTFFYLFIAGAPAANFLLFVWV